VAALGDKIYAVGGWPFDTGGPEPTTAKPAAKKYHDTMAVLDLASPALVPVLSRHRLLYRNNAGDIVCLDLRIKCG
jgi:hypothetical protein